MFRFPLKLQSVFDPLALGLAFRRDTWQDWRSIRHRAKSSHKQNARRLARRNRRA